MLVVHYQRFLGAISYDSLKAAYVPLTHCYLREFSQDMTLDDIYHEMQGEVWSFNGEAREVIKSCNLSHTSMSVGDIICKDGNLFICAPFGWDDLGSMPPYTSDTLWLSREIDRIKIVSDRDCLSPDVLTVEQFAAVEFEYLVEIAGYIEKWVY